MKESEAPTLVLGYNRPDLLSEVLTRTVQSRARKIYVSIDGPLKHKAGDGKLVEQCAEIATLLVPKNRLILRTSDEHLGCKVGVAQGITWFFDQEEEGIVLEDDTLPSRSFFRYASELLDLYRDDSRVMKISGFNLFSKTNDFPADYWFSNVSFSWGWASWRRAWQYYDQQMPYWDSLNRLGMLRFPNFDRASRRVFSLTREGAETWDYQWDYAIATQNGLHVIPRVNLIRNIGFGPNATHTKVDLTGRSRILESELDFPINHGLPVKVPNFRYHGKLRRRQLKDRAVSLFRRRLGMRFLGEHETRVKQTESLAQGVD